MKTGFFVVMNKIAIIGGGFNGLCVAAHIMRLATEQGKKAYITVFDATGLRSGRIFSPELPDNFTLNHETANMGSLHPFSSVGTDDFYNWIQEKKDEPLKSLSGTTLAKRYKKWDLDNPSGYLPRSLFGHYLVYRLDQMSGSSQTDNYTFSYLLKKVESVVKVGGKYKIIWDDKKELFDTVIIATGFWYNSKDNTEIVYKGEEKWLPKASDPIAVIGSSLSAIEVSLALADKGYTNVTMYSRHGRLPKVRGNTHPYIPRYVTTTALEKLQNKFGYVESVLLLPLLKKEFDYAYFVKREGLYRREGIHWQEILQNTNPLRQLEEDIKKAESGEELVWRSVLTSLYEYEGVIWRGLSGFSRHSFLQKYSSLLLSFIAPMPLFQAKRLLKYMRKKKIKLVAGVDHYQEEHSRWVIQIGGKKYVKRYLIDARGPAKHVGTNAFLRSLIDQQLLEKNTAGGIFVNRQLQVVVKNKVQPNLYAIGPIVYGERPHNSTVFATEYAELVASYIVNSLDSSKVHAVTEAEAPFLSSHVDFLPTLFS